MSMMDPTLGMGMYTSGVQIKNTYSYDQNNQTDSILKYNTEHSQFQEETSTSMNQHNSKGTLMTGGMCAIGGAALGACSGGGKGAVAGAVIGFAAPTIINTIKGLLGNKSKN